MIDGKVIASRCWGYANLDTAAPMTAGTRLPICSISKQFTCQVLLACIDDPARWDGYVSRYLPSFTGQLPTVRQLCHNQSGLRDYWALTVLQGALAEQVFSREDALPLIARMKTGTLRPVRNIPTATAISVSSRKSLNRKPARNLKTSTAGTSGSRPR